MNSRSSENRTLQKTGVQEALLTIVLRCMKNLDRAARAPLPFSGYWIDPKLYKPDAELTVLLFDQLLQDVFLGSLDTNEDGEEIWIDQYGRELEGITMWAELPWPKFEQSCQ